MLYWDLFNNSSTLLCNTINAAYCVKITLSYFYHNKQNK